MKKLFSVLAVLFVLGTTSVFAKTGLGVQFNGNISGGNFLPGASVTFKLNKVPCVFAADFAANNGAMSAGLTADWWIANPVIEGTWHYYYGVGVGAGVTIVNNNYGGFAIGPRAVLGTNVFLINNFLELYAQGAWQPTLAITSAGTGFSWACFPVALGFRFWF